MWLVDSLQTDSSGCPLYVQNETFYVAERMPGRRHPLRDYLTARIRHGEFASVREIMIVGSLPRQTVNRWLREASVDLAKARMRHIAVMHRQAEDRLAGKPDKRPSKRELRRGLERSIRRFNRINGAHSKIPDEAADQVPSVPASGRDQCVSEQALEGDLLKMRQP